MAHDLTAHLMGGLGNQMFQYAAARALSLKNGARLYLDRRSGFARDTVYERSYELGAFPIDTPAAGFWKRTPFAIEAARRKLREGRPSSVSDRLYGSYLQETNGAYLPEVAGHQLHADSWMWGYWQSERYFSGIAPIISRELAPPAPEKKQFLDVAELMAGSASVAVGVRLFEEVPGDSKAGVGGLTPLRCFNAAAKELARRVPNPVFFVFCTTQSPELQKLDLPGPVQLITHENGFEGSVARLWLLTRCRHHIIANSSFYWWGAWLRESMSPDSQIFASPLFSNKDTVPARWTSLERA